jgi:adenylate cyclase
MGRIKTWVRKRGQQTLPGLTAVLIIAALQTFPVPIISPALNRVGLLIFDSYQRMSPRPYEEAAVRVVDIDDETIRQYGQWPWPRTDIARLTLALADAGAAAIAFDIVFSETDRTSPRQLSKRYAATDPAVAEMLAKLPDNDAQLAEVFKATPSLAGYFLTNDHTDAQAEPKAGLAVSGSAPSSVPHYRSAVMPLPALEAAAAGNGFLSIAPDDDSIIRRSPMIAMQGNALLPSLSLDALRVARHASSVVIKTSDGSGEGGNAGDVVALRVADFEVPTTRAGELWMHYTKPVPDRVVPAWKLLSGALSAQEQDRLFNGHIVFVGAGAIGLRDLRATPLNDAELGVMIHAQATEQMILQHFLYRPDWVVGVERLLLLVLGIGLVFLLPRLGAAYGALLGGAAVLAIGGGSWIAFSRYQFLLDPTWPILGLITAYVLGTILVYYQEEQQRAYIHNAFDRYLAPELVRRIAEDPGQLKLGGEEREMTVLFCDIRSFSSISEKLLPNEIIRFLIAFLTPMTDLLLSHKATIDKYIGDAILAFWNAPLDDPNQYENAARGALAMVERLKVLNVEMPHQEAEPWPGHVKIGIGLNTGPCCVGNMGSQQRLSYSLIGDTVNLASRIEGLTKYYGVQIAIGNGLHDHIPHFASLVLDQVRVVGRDSPETIRVLLGDEALKNEANFNHYAAKHDAMLAAYHGQDWSLAGALLDELDEEAAQHGLTHLYALYRDRIVIFATNPPGANWDGVFTATEK